MKWCACSHLQVKFLYRTRQASLSVRNDEQRTWKIRHMNGASFLPNWVRCFPWIVWHPILCKGSNSWRYKATYPIFPSWIFLIHLRVNTSVKYGSVTVYFVLVGVPFFTQSRPYKKSADFFVLLCSDRSRLDPFCSIHQSGEAFFCSSWIFISSLLSSFSRSHGISF